MKPTEGERQVKKKPINSPRDQNKRILQSQNAQTSSEEIGTSYASEFSKKNTTRFYIIVRFFNQSIPREISKFQNRSSFCVIQQGVA